jgi:hypothetical protein
MADNYSKKSVMGLVGALSIILVIILFAVTGAQISKSIIGISLVVILILISLTSLILGIMSLIECKHNPGLKGKFFGIAAIILSMLFIIFIVLITLLNPVPPA